MLTQVMTNLLPQSKFVLESIHSNAYTDFIA